MAPGPRLYYDCFSGISGDMHLGALIDLGVPADWLRSQLNRLALPDPYRLSVVADQRRGISGTRATVEIESAGHVHRHLPDVVSLIQTAHFDQEVEDRAIEIFEALARAEAAVHGQEIEQVHFHEVGATDAIIDIVGGVLALHYLNPSEIYCSEIEVGSGTVRCEHGLLPVPAPATARLLEGLPCHYGRVDGEATTPTGAAILRVIVDHFEPPGSFTASRWGLGLGQKEFAVANLLRIAASGENAVDSTYEIEEVRSLTADIDDQSPEACEPLLEALWRAGVLDVQLIATSMKKQRPGFRLSALYQPKVEPVVLQTLFRNSSTIGARTHDVRKWMLPRKLIRVSTPLGEVGVKVVQVPGGSTRAKIEHDDVMALVTPERTYLETRRLLERSIDLALSEQSTS